MADIMKEDDERDGGSEELVLVDDPLEADAAGRDDDDDQDGDDERIAARDAESGAESDDEREAIRERRRQEKLERKQRREEAIKRDKLERDFLLKRNDELERRLSAQEQRAAQIDLSQLDVQIQSAAREAETAERVIAKAVEAGNGADVTQAMRYRDQALARLQQLSAVKQAAIQRPAATTTPPIDDMTMMRAQQFLSENKWYDPQGRDEDSAIVLAIDQSLVRDGYNPQTDDYWAELRRRAARRLPERFKADGKTAESRAPRGGPAVGSGKEHAPASTRREVYISPERKQALVDAGVWDDPTLRMKYVKRYAEYDRANRSRA